jgi:multidrug resistance efflux pump
MADSQRRPDTSTDVFAAERAHRSVFRLVTTHKGHRNLVIVLAAMVATMITFLVLVPWQQTVSGSGKVTSFAPEARPQTVESRINGRIVRWYVREGARVRKGDTIAILADINVNFLDSNLLGRLQSLRDNVESAQDRSIAVATERRKQALQRYDASRARLDNARIECATARIRYVRADTLFRQDVVSRREFETAQLNLQKAVADSVNAVASVNVAQQDVTAALAEEERVVNQAIVSVQEADVRLSNTENRLGFGVVVAPLDGTVVRIAKAGAGQTVKEGDELALIVPTTTDQAVEIYVSSMDAALISPGRMVSLHFSGFPAFQFSGWRNVNVGIFHGTVKVVDAVDEGTGRFRVLVVPFEEPGYTQWPDERFLRQGTDASAWVLLDEVSIGYELWRQLMGFPPQFPVPVKDERVKQQETQAKAKK